MKIHRSLLAVIALFLSIGCTELVDRSYDRIIAEQFDATDQDLASLVGSAYINWRDVILNWDGFHRAQELSADQLVIPARPNGWVDGGVYRRIHEHKWTSDEGIVVQVWNRAYAGITNCNRIIYQIESNIIPIDPEALESTISELKVLRASYYYVLLDLYGNVPIITQFDVPVGFLPEQSSRREVYDFIVGELVENVDHLSESNDQSTYGKFNKWAGYALLAKLYLNAEVYKSEAEWEKAIQAADMVINSGLYALEASQRNVFVTNNENSKEIIFAIPFDENYVTEWNAFDLHMQTLQPGSQATYNLISTPWGGICAIPQFIDTYDPDDLRLINGWIQGPQLTASGEPIIASLGTLAGQPLSFVNEVPGIDYSEEIHGYRLGKFEIKQNANVQLSNDWPLLRYADVLLMKAESLLRLGNIEEAAALVTEVRERNFPQNPEKASVSGADLLGGSNYSYGLDNRQENTVEGGDDIKFGRFLDELSWEFAQEGRRRQDLIRFGVFTTKSWLNHSPNGDDKILFPLPRIALNTNPNLTQNPGY